MDDRELDTRLSRIQATLDLILQRLEEERFEEEQEEYRKPNTRSGRIIKEKD